MSSTATESKSDEKNYNNKITKNIFIIFSTTTQSNDVFYSDLLKELKK